MMERWVPDWVLEWFVRIGIAAATACFIIAFILK
jgi:hypothetical protein